jgi:DNA repair exonuclease SbcCD nuclease subunit
MRPPILVISDPQFHNFKAHSTTVDGVNSRLLQQMAAWNEAIEIGVKAGCKMLVIPGDVFEIRGQIKPSVFNKVTELVYLAMQKGLDVVAIPGNHDMEHFDAGESAIDTWDMLFLEGFGSMPQRDVTVMKIPEVVMMGGYRIAGVPYIHDVKKFKSALRDIGSHNPEITLIHQGVDDFDPTGALTTGLTARWLEDNCPGRIICGHYHFPAIKGRVLNPGALVQHRFGDEGNHRGCWVVYDSKDEPEFHRIKSPEFVTWRDHGATHLPSAKGNFVRVITKSVKQGEKIRKKAEEAGALSVIVQVEKEFKTAHEKTVAMGKPRDMLGEYLDIEAKYSPHKAAILGLFDKVCLGHA